ncbi:MAG: cbb3-type cytochrome c oxidase subunit I [Phycisphaerales bacterium]
MSVIHDPVKAGIHGGQAPGGTNYINNSKGILSWLLTVDHKRIGLMYMVCVLGAFLLGGSFAIMLRTMLFIRAASETPISEGAQNMYNQAFTLHGAILVFMFIIPAVPAILGNMVLPLMLGAKDVAFPRLNLLSWYCWVGGAIFFMFVLINGGLDTGWTFYTPYSSSTTTAATTATMGAFILGFSSILTGLNFIATIHMLRPPGMGWFQMPLFLWALYATSVIQVLATPVLAITLLLLMAERILHVGIFDPALGGDPVLFQHFFWFYSHPAVYIMVLPAMGIISELMSTFCRRHIFGYSFIAFSSVAIALLGFLVWGHHMFTSGQSAMTNAVFSLITFSVAIPSAIKVFNWLATMYKGSIWLATPMLYALAFIWLFTIGGLTGVFLGALSLDIMAHDTYFVVAHFHYVMVGSMLTAFIGGMYYWWPKMFGKMYSEPVAKVAWFLIFFGFNLTFFIQFIAGSKGMPRRYADFVPEYAIYHEISTIGSYVLASGLFLVLFNWIHSLKYGRKAPQNPWGANTLEWHTSSPPPTENFVEDPPVSEPYVLGAWEYDASIEGFVHNKEKAAKLAQMSHH